jgi:exodeoxyribonuclease I
MNTFLFYDIETSGLNKAFDQVMQFAAIRTDENLNELDRYELLVKLNPDVTPSARALITHRISIDTANTGLCEYKAMQKIHAWLNQPGTISLGYNTLGFDDEFLRFGFYKNLLPPYTHQYACGCSRMDLFPMTALYFLFKNNVLDWPKIEDKTTLKLEHLSAANNLATGMAHDAMVDVEATLELAKRFKQENKMWRYLCGYFNKEEDVARSLKLPKVFADHQQAIIVNGSFGAKNNYHATALSLGNHYHYRNQTLWLRLDDPQLSDATKDNFTEKTWVIRKKVGETNLLLPFNERFTKYITTEKQKIITENVIFLKANKKLLHEVTEYNRNYTYPFIPDLDVDAALYQNGFPTPYETGLCEDFHRAPPDKKHTIIDRMLNNNLRTQMIRVLARNYPQYLPEKYQTEFDIFLENISDNNNPIKDYSGKPRMTLQQLQLELAEIKQNEKLDKQQQEALASLE